MGWEGQGNDWVDDLIWFMKGNRTDMSIERTIRSTTWFEPHWSFGNLCGICGKLWDLLLFNLIEMMEWDSSFTIFERRKCWRKLITSPCVWLIFVVDQEPYLNSPLVVQVNGLWRSICLSLIRISISISPFVGQSKMTHQSSNRTSKRSIFFKFLFLCFIDE